MSHDRIQQRIESAVERAIREGAFDDLPGAGKPLDLGDHHDPDWWIKKHIREGNIDGAECMPAVFRLRKKREQLIANLAEFTSLASLRAAITALNDDIRRENRRPSSGPAVVPLVELDEPTVIERWRAARAPVVTENMDAQRVPDADASGDSAHPAQPVPRRGLLNRLFRLSS